MANYNNFNIKKARQDLIDYISKASELNVRKLTVIINSYKLADKIMGELDDDDKESED